MTRAPGDSQSSEQLRLRFPKNVLGFEDMCISSANAGAIGIIRAMDDWPTSALCLVGPADSGRSTAATAWAAEADAPLISGDMLNQYSHGEIEAFCNGNIAIDDADQISEESNFLFLLKRIESKGFHLLLTTRQSPSAWIRSNADLASRLSAMPVAEFLAPDEVLLKARLSAACRRRFVKLPDEVATYLAMRMEHSYAAIEGITNALDEAMEVSGRKATIPLAREVLREDEHGSNN